MTLKLHNGTRRCYKCKVTFDTSHNCKPAPGKHEMIHRTVWWRFAPGEWYSVLPKDRWPKKGLPSTVFRINIERGLMGWACKHCKRFADSCNVVGVRTDADSPGYLTAD